VSALALPEARKRLVYLLATGAVGVSLLAAGLLIVIVRPPSGSLTPAPVEPAVLGAVPAFSATRQDGSTITEKDLAGQLWVANFVFTRCPNVCPTFTAKMAGLQMVSGRRLPQLKLVSFTVDPDYDTPAVLSEYGQKYQADPARWWFLTAPKAVLDATIAKGLLAPLDRGDGKDLKQLVHSSYFVLVDRQLQVRGFYRFSDTSAVEQVMRDAETLARTQPKQASTSLEAAPRSP
jgi:protein SCO1/2